MTNLSVEPATQPISKIEPYIRRKRAARVLGVTMEGAALTLTKPIMFSHPSRSAHQLGFRLHLFQSFWLRISSCVPETETGVPT